MYVTRAQLENIRIISKFELDLTKGESAGWHVILGDNGSGKSTLMRALAIALIGPENAAALRQDWSAWLAGDAESGSISLTIRADSNLDRWADKGKTANKPIRPRVSFSSQNVNAELVSAEFNGEYTKRTVWGSGSGWFSAAFGPFRRFRGGDREYEKLYYSHPRLAAHLSAFGEDVALSEALAWIKNIQFRALEKDSSARALTQGIIHFINQSELLPHNARIEEITSSGVMVDNGAGTRVPVEEMSDGYRSILSMTFELLRAMDAAFGTETLVHALNTNNGTVELPGVILIDEIDAHLHPAWQKRIGNWFTDRFPKAQFFVTTHSPIICQAAERGSIWRLASPGTDEPSGRVIGQDLERLIYGNVLEAYSTEYFGTDVTRSRASKDMLRQLAELNRKSLRGALSPDEEEERSILQRRMPSRASNLQE
ncbi:AAA family ATPase [uncultured Roseibium sp.]|uniref:AAA family ATPase n=1 Tax=uncultured Roseibium sp. TaxID=1936171 RepID=UPI0032179E32